MKLHEMKKDPDVEFNDLIRTAISTIDKLHALSSRFDQQTKPTVNSQIDSLIHVKGSFAELIEVFKQKRA